MPPSRVRGPFNPLTAAVAVACCLFFIASARGQEQPAAGRERERATPGPQPDGSVVLPNQWSLRPAGRQVDVGDFPVAIAVHPAGRHAVVLHCGYGPHELVVLDVAAREIVSRRALGEAFQGLAFDSAGERLFVSGGAAETILVFRLEQGSLVPDGSAAADGVIRLRDEKLRGIPCGLAVSRDGRELFVANVWGQSVSRVRLGDGQPVRRRPTCPWPPDRHRSLPQPSPPPTIRRSRNGPNSSSNG